MAMTEALALKQLDKAVAALAKQKGAKAVDVCATFLKIKTSLPYIMFLIGMIPRYGKQIVGVMQIVVQAAEYNCVGPSPAPLARKRRNAK